MEALNEESGTWYMVFTTLYAEKRVKTRLDELGITNLLPLVNSTLLWRNKQIKKEVPIIPRCIFVRFSLSERKKLSDIPSLLLPANLCDWQISVQQMEHINLALSEGDLFKVWSLVNKCNNLG